MTEGRDRRSSVEVKEKKGQRIEKIISTTYYVSVDEYFYPAVKVAKSTARRQIETALDLLSDNELKIIQGTIDGILKSKESEK